MDILASIQRSTETRFAYTIFYIKFSLTFFTVLCMDPEAEAEAEAVLQEHVRLLHES